MACVHANHSVSVIADEIHTGSDRIKLKPLNGFINGINGTLSSMPAKPHTHVLVNGDHGTQAQLGAVLEDSVPDAPKTEPIAIVGMGS